MQYLVGQLICLFRFILLVYAFLVFHMMKRTNVCDITAEEAFDNPQLWQTFFKRCYTALVLLVFTSATKVMLGVVICLMVLSLYLRILSIFKAQDPRHWNKTFGIWIYASMAAIIIINLSVMGYFIAYFAENYNKNFTEFPSFKEFLTHYNQIVANYDSFYQRFYVLVGLVYGIQNLIISISFVVFVKLVFNLIDNP